MREGGAPTWAVESANTKVVVNPTTIDTEYMHNKVHNHDNEIITLKWTSSHSTLKYLDPIFPVIKKLKEKYTFNFVIISDDRPKNNENL